MLWCTWVFYGTLLTCILTFSFIFNETQAIKKRSHIYVIPPLLPKPHSTIGLTPKGSLELKGAIWSEDGEVKCCQVHKVWLVSLFPSAIST